MGGTPGLPGGPVQAMASQVPPTTPTAPTFPTAGAGTPVTVGEAPPPTQAPARSPAIASPSGVHVGIGLADDGRTRPGRRGSTRAGGSVAGLRLRPGASHRRGAACAAGRPFSAVGPVSTDKRITDIDRAGFGVRYILRRVARLV